MKVLLIDDEEPARIELRRLLSVHVEVTVVGDAADVDAALALTLEHRPDLVFLDIKLAGENGFDYVGRLPEPGPRIVFVTAHDRYALRGFECNALDYLLKPVHPDRLAETLRRARLQEVGQRLSATEEDAIFVRAGSVARLVPWREILTITASGNYTQLRLGGGHPLVVLRPLKEWLTLAPSGFFVQVHRSTLVQQAAIREWRPCGEKKSELFLRDGSAVPVGRDYATAVRRALSLV